MVRTPSQQSYTLMGVTQTQASLYLNRLAGIMDLKKECKRILTQNWRDGYTVPSPRLYPFQWNWDSGFIALGYLHMDPERAYQELENLFKGQWTNGFLPHIVFHNAEKYGDKYFPSANYWDSNVSEFAPENVRTTGISQPPIHGYVLERIFRQEGKSKRLGLLFDKVIHYHRCLYDHRDTLQNGLINVWHNWETGMDNAPWWDQALGRIDASEVAGIKLNRQDVKVVSNYEETRPSDDEYRRYLWLLNTLKEDNYGSCPSDFPFQFIDLTFNSILLASTASIVRLGPELDRDVHWFEAKLEEGRKSLNELCWNEEDGSYYPYDIVSREQITGIGAASFLPFFGGVPDPPRAKILEEKLRELCKMYGVPTFDPSHPKYEAKKYWRGPVWINMNYMIWVGLQEYGWTDTAIRLKNSTIEMVERFGLREYYPVDVNADSAFGAVDFSWSASLILDMINE